MPDNRAFELDLNTQFVQALNCMDKTVKSVFITGRAGTGKSTLLHHFRKITKKNIAVLAPTGVAALNVKGQTIHSFFGFRPDITTDAVHRINPASRSLYRKLDAIVIDEVSMVRADLMDCIDTFLKMHGKSISSPFGGIQMIFIGDLYQLPPVIRQREKEAFSRRYKSHYFFDAEVFSSGLDMDFIELQKVYRQKEGPFLDILNAIRNNTATDDDMAAINTRCLPEHDHKKDFALCLTTTNDLTDDINLKKLSAIKTKACKYHGLIEGNFDAKDLPTSSELAVKQGAQVMLLNNDPEGRWINGSIGRIDKIQSTKNGYDILRVELSDGKLVEVTPYTWNMYEFVYDKSSRSVVSDIIGTFTQYPIRLAWAVTIHKSQGLTFDRVIIDLGRGTFSHGQLYVALSRCTSLEGIVLKKPVSKKHILMDWRVVNFITKYQYSLAKQRQPVEERISIIEDAIKHGKRLNITYLKTGDEKSERIIQPSYIGEIEYQTRKFMGIRAFCTKRKSERVFHLERILNLSLLED
ncbi:MAG: AAA family ATPase [Nitrospiraceae bacterium]|nr:AAA family ATPase [Nitrospiraceae bacterium]